ncbi:Ppx/GppA phosphatase family protein [Reyranella sp. CPCC 100927]|uniref:Ppx/GppA phosphatase family protein n=1 Tax=Reyranella sp. CPCC 100927 TaxID=2599616 RepID=UPI0011B53A09|nr:Ppx/GppA phosphatase family protein [Reyranella sp. CPCC 100927]TWT10271.1 Ppx/GppA family phosphatase [Reyranella sp. CPCC 100927]
MSEAGTGVGGWRCGRFAHTFASIDLGTNNCRLLVARASATGFDVLDSYSRPVRLGEGVASQQVLCSGAIERTMEALDACANKIQKAGVTRSRHIATEACRRALNSADFLARVQQRTGLAFQIISPREEARLALASCESLIDRQSTHVLLVDIGGGSTEVVWVSVRPREAGACGLDLSILDTISIPWGVVTLTEARLAGQSKCQPLAAGIYEQMVAQIKDALAPFCRGNGVGGRVAAGGVQMIGASGTVTTMAAYGMGLKRYHRATVDGTSIDRDTILRIGGHLARMSVEELSGLPCIGWERAELALAGGAILEAVCRQWPVQRVVVADRGLREGVLVDLMREADRECDPLTRRVEETTPFTV